MAGGLMDAAAPEENAPRGPAPRAGDVGPGAPAGAPDASAMGASEGTAPNVTPDEQASYDQFVDNGYNLIYDEQRLPAVIKALGSGDPVNALASTAASIVIALEDQAEDAGAELPEGVPFHGGVEILEDLASLSARADIHQYNDQELEAALYRGMDIYMQARQQQGKLDQGKYRGELDQLIAADRSGTLSNMLPPGMVEQLAGGAARNG